MSDRPKFDPDKAVEYVGADGKVWPIRILATDRIGSDFPIIGLSHHGTHETLEEFRADGTARAWTGHHGGYLRNRMIRREGWVRVYADTGRGPGLGSKIFASEDEALRNIPFAPCAVARIEWEEPE